tara:strand:+ start:111 stop:416 length:306 start_codon:yes stop_codon:yes gene_type:complete
MNYIYKRKYNRRFTDFHRKNIILLTQSGLTIPQVACKLDISVNMIRKFFTRWDRKKDVVVPIYIGSKKEPYNEDENMYGTYPQYKWEDLSQSEIDSYLKLN